MTGFRKRASAWVGVACALLAAPACGTDAQGVGDCREVEQARCAAAASCGIVDDVGSCQRFYRDHCLHGTTTASPGAPAVDDCAQAILAAGDCAGNEELCVAPMTSTNACSLILKPELLTECRFLSPNPVPQGEGGAPATAGAGGQGATDPGSAEGGTPATGGVGTG